MAAVVSSPTTCADNNSIKNVVGVVDIKKDTDMLRALLVLVGLCMGTCQQEQQQLYVRTAQCTVVPSGGVSVQTKDVTQCALYCEQQQVCDAFNWLPPSTCELLPQHDNQYEDRTGCGHYYVSKDFISKFRAQIEVLRLG